MAGAYRAFGNDGLYNEPYAVTKVEFPDGKVVELEPEPEPAMSDYTAYMITDMLKTAMSESGTGSTANITDIMIDSKKESTNLNDIEGVPDSWFTSYSTNYTISVWTGGYTNDEGKRTVMPTEGRKVAQHLFKNIMSEISKDIDTPDFERPDSVVEVAVEKGSNPPKLPSDYTPSENIITELFVKGHEPSSVSEKFDELDPVQNLKADYKEDEEAIQVTWDYDDNDASFKVSMSVDGGDMKELSPPKDTSLDITDIEAEIGRAHV